MKRLAAAALAALCVAGPALAARAAAPEPVIATIAGTGQNSSNGDLGPAAAAAVGHPRGLAIAPDGGYVIAEPFLGAIRRVSPDGTITTIAGIGRAGFSGDGLAVLAELNLPHDVAFAKDGGVLVDDTLNQRIRLISTDGSIRTVVGTGVRGFAGDGGPATGAEIDSPRGIASAPDGSLLIADTSNQRIRRVSPDGTITTVAGSGARGFAGDGGPATAAALSNPFAVAPVPDGGFLIADTANDRVRRVWADGTITTVAGNGERGFSGDGGPATGASLDQPYDVAALPDGGFLIADTGNDRIRRVLPDGTITTVAGDGQAGFAGDGGPPAAAELDQPKAIAVLPDALGFLVADSANNRVRLVRLDVRAPFTITFAGGPIRVRAAARPVVRYTVSIDAVVTVEVRRRSLALLRSVARASAGANRLVLRRLKVGTYRVVLAARAPDGRTATTSMPLRVVA